MNKLLFLLILFPFCIAAQTTTTVRIDPAAAVGGTASQIFDKVEYIPLETTRESLFGDIQQFRLRHIILSGTSLR